MPAATTYAPAPSRVPIKLLLLYGLWGLFILWTGWGTVSSGWSLLFGSRQANMFQAMSAAPLFALNLWACAAGLVFGLVISNPFAWLNGRRLIIGSMALAMILGRLASGSVASLMLGLPGGGAAVFAATPFLLLIGGAFVAVGIALFGGMVFGFFVGIPVMFFNQIFAFEHSLAVFRHQSNGLAGYIVRFVFWLRNEPLPDIPPDDSKGARFATRDETLALIRLTDPAAMAFGYADGPPLFLKTDKHILIMASTRSGKGVTLIIPHLLRYQGSAFVLDPKGENAKATIRQRRQINNKVHVLDPFGITGLPQARFNPLSRFTPENMEAESKALAAALFVVGERERDHWTASGQQLLAAIILYVYVSPNVPPEKKDLPTVRRQLLGSLKNTLNEMMTINAADGLLSDLAFSFLETPEREFGSIVSTAQRQTEILDNPFMIACLSATGKGDEVDFKAWKTGTMTVYLCLSAPKFPTFNRWLRLLLTSALDEMTDTLAPPPLPVCFMLDELATLGHLAAVENAVGLAAGYGIQLVSVFQDVAQMRDLYKGRWASFIGNAGVRALFNLDDFESAEYWSKFVGGRLVETRSTQQDVYGYSKGDNVGESMRPLLPPDEIMMKFASNKMLVLAQGAHPVVTDRVAYFQDNGLAGLWDDPRQPVSSHRVPPSPSAPPPATPPAAGPAAPPSTPSPGPESAVPTDDEPKGFFNDLFKQPAPAPTQAVPQVTELRQGDAAPVSRTAAPLPAAGPATPAPAPKQSLIPPDGLVGALKRHFEGGRALPLRINNPSAPNIIRLERKAEADRKEYRVGGMLGMVVAGILVVVVTLVSTLMGHLDDESRVLLGVALFLFLFSFAVYRYWGQPRRSPGTTPRKRS